MSHQWVCCLTSTYTQTNTHAHLRTHICLTRHFCQRCSRTLDYARTSSSAWWCLFLNHCNSQSWQWERGWYECVLVMCVCRACMHNSTEAHLYFSTPKCRIPNKQVSLLICIYVNTHTHTHTYTRTSSREIVLFIRYQTNIFLSIASLSNEREGALRNTEYQLRHLEKKKLCR